MTTTGYVACDYDDGDMLADVRHGEIRETDAQARQDAAKDRYQGVRYVAEDGHLYVDRPDSAANRSYLSAHVSELVGAQSEQPARGYFGGGNLSQRRLDSKGK